MARVLALDVLTDDLFELVVAREGLSYRAGDCTLLVGPDQVDSRPYSFSSHPDQDELRFLIRTPAGRGPSFARWLSQRQPGDEVTVGTPFGLFSPGRTPAEIWLATGTGLAPFLACLRGRSGPEGVELFAGVRSPAEAVFRTFLESRCVVHWRFSRTPPFERVSVAEKAFPLANDREYFLCGNGAMVDDCRRGLLSRGVPALHLHEERFFPSRIPR